MSSKKLIPYLFTLLLSTTPLMIPITALAALPTEPVEGKNLPTLAPMIERISGSVVSISVQGLEKTNQDNADLFRFFFGPNVPMEQLKQRPFKGLGSGVIIDSAKGYVVTNNHVIQNADKIKIQLNNGNEYDATLVGADAMSDIALLQINPKQLKKKNELLAIQLANSDQLRVGDFVVALGNPFGLGQTVTSGIVSATGRGNLSIENLENFIQTDAAINRGNSGGALVNLNGELVGINTAILGQSGNIGIGFAIPSNMMNNLTTQIAQYGEVKRGVLGIKGGELTSDLADAFGHKNRNGAFVSQVFPNSAAAKAGLKEGDIILSMNGLPIKSFSELRAKVATAGAGAKLTLGLLRNDKEINTVVTLDASDSQLLSLAEVPDLLNGATLENAKKAQGVKIVSIKENSHAAKMGLEEGDIIVGINRQPVKNIKELKSFFNKETTMLALHVKRGEQMLFIMTR